MKAGDRVDILSHHVTASCLLLLRFVIDQVHPRLQFELESAVQVDAYNVSSLLLLLPSRLGSWLIMFTV